MGSFDYLGLLRLDERISLIVSSVESLGYPDTSGRQIFEKGNS